jgi:hypothetical protein
MLWGQAFICMLAYKKKSIQPQHKRRSINLKNGVLKVFFLTQGITGEPKFCSALAFEMVSRCVRDDIGGI